MSFVRKPRPYSSGMPSLPVTPPTKSPTAPSPRPPRPRTQAGPRSGWATAVTALAVLGLAALLLVGGTGLAELLYKDAQFRTAAAGITDVQR